MSNYRKKHAVLEYFYDFDFENQGDPTDHYDPLRGSLTSDKIHDKLNLSFEEIDIMLIALKEDGYIRYVDDSDHVNIFLDFYHITAKGRVAHKEEFYLKQIWYNSRKTWFEIVPIVISILSLGLSIITWIYK